MNLFGATAMAKAIISGPAISMMVCGSSPRWADFDGCIVSRCVVCVCVCTWTVNVCNMDLDVWISIFSVHLKWNTRFQEIPWDTLGVCQVLDTYFVQQNKSLSDLGTEESRQVWRIGGFRGLEEDLQCRAPCALRVSYELSQLPFSPISPVTPPPLNRIRMTVSRKLQFHW